MNIVWSILEKVDKYDRNWSKKVHDMKYSWTLDHCLLLPVYAFNPKVVPVLTYLIALLFT